MWVITVILYRHVKSEKWYVNFYVPFVKTIWIKQNDDIALKQLKKWTKVILISPDNR